MFEVYRPTLADDVKLTDGTFRIHYPNDYFFSALEIYRDSALKRFHPDRYKEVAYSYIFFTNDDKQPKPLYSAADFIPDF